ncbi:hypothetical protein JKP88DRAFT_283269 [Tribonema minus]|uniref:Uncharacterized protein n=1 Tax=Tribonema minus TaxID=303371 RepID=A0A835YK21_9STRA|nr:hypothetical protein JKP88DRAFT_283269 [Tribonema minus]
MTHSLLRGKVRAATSGDAAVMAVTVRAGTSGDAAATAVTGAAADSPGLTNDSVASTRVQPIDVRCHKDVVLMYDGADALAHVKEDVVPLENSSLSVVVEEGVVLMCDGADALAHVEEDVLLMCDGTAALAHVGSVQQGELRCDSMGLSASMMSLKFQFKGILYYAARTHYQMFPDQGGRHAWMGELVGQVGFVNIVWDDACSPSVFQLDVHLEDGADNTRRVITSVPCSPSTATSKQCTWLATVETDLREEYHEEDRRMWEKLAAAEAPNPDRDAFDKDLALLQQMLTGDSAATEVFARSGGRRLHEEGAVLMPSGRRLDDGSVVRVLWLYTNRVRDRWTDATITSKIVSGVVSANQALINSNAGFQLEAAAIINIDYDDVSHVQSLSDLSYSAIPGDLNYSAIPGVTFLRDFYRADLVQMIIEAPEYCGYGNLLSSASSSFASYGYSVVYSDCIASYSHIHEIGHNMGCQHNVENSGQTTVWPYGDGYRYCNDGVTQAPYFRTIMSYACTGATRVPYFSSPNIYYQGVATGTAATADNLRVLLQTKYTVANFRQGGSTPTAAPTAPPATLTPATTITPSPVATVVPTPTPTAKPTAAPAPLVSMAIRLSGYDYSRGQTSREGIDYHDSDAKNKGSSDFRIDQGVDCAPGVVSYTTPGEWLQYTRSFVGGLYDVVLEASSAQWGGTVELQFRKASGELAPGTLGSTVELQFRKASGEVAPGTRTTSMFFPKTGNFSTFAEYSLATQVVVPSGTYRMRIIWVTGGLNARTLTLEPSTVVSGDGGGSGILIPTRSFFAGAAVVSPAADARGLTLENDGHVSWISSGDSIVLSLNVTHTGDYNVAYSLTGLAPALTPLRMFLLKGRTECLADGGNLAPDGGIIYADSFTTGGWSNYLLFHGSPVTLEQGDLQEYTLCFEKADWVYLGALCIATYCPWE